MTHKEFIKFIRTKNPDITVSEACGLVAIISESIYDALCEGQSVILPRIGTLYPQYIVRGNNKEWRNPSNGKKYRIKDKVRLKVKPMRSFEKRLTDGLI